MHMQQHNFLPLYCKSLLRVTLFFYDSLSTVLKLCFISVAQFAMKVSSKLKSRFPHKNIILLSVYNLVLKTLN
jgi:hypothetical protein